ncbi:MAG: hypothetical protein ACRCTE_06865 [Cellulosilyticaceae bacterium]
MAVYKEYEQLYQEFKQHYQVQEEMIDRKVLGYQALIITIEEYKPIMIEVECNNNQYFTIGKDRGGKLHIRQGKLPVYYKRGYI